MSIKIQANPDTEFESALVNRQTQVFRERWPQNIEHIMRLTSERLLLLLKDKTVTDTDDICNLAIALERIHTIHRGG